MIPSFERRHSAGHRLTPQSWGAVAGAAIGVVGSSLSSDKGGGAGSGSSQSSKDPWMQAQPWLMSNIAQGQALQQRYTDQPFSGRQLAAQDNQYAQSDYMRSLIPSLLGQVQGQQVGYDRTNSLAKPKAWDWGGAAGGGPSLGQSSVLNARDPVIVRPEQQQQRGLLDDYADTSFTSGANFLMQSPTQGQLDKLGYTPGKYGSWTYGDMPAAGTKAAQEQKMYFLLGGSDPRGLYRAATAGPGGDTGIGSGADGDGAGPGGAGATW